MIIFSRANDILLVCVKCVYRFSLYFEKIPTSLQAGSNISSLYKDTRSFPERNMTLASSELFGRPDPQATHMGVSASLGMKETQV